MARGDSGITALSLRRLELYKTLQDIYNVATFLGLHDTADDAVKLHAARTINGIDFDGSVDIDNYCTSSTASDVAAKTATLTGFNKVANASIYIKFDNTTQVSNNTLNINSSGAAPIIYNGVVVGPGDIVANIIYHIIYDGTNYVIAGTSKIAYSEFVPSTDYDAGVHGLVPAPAVGDDEEKYLMADCTWKIPTNYHQCSHTYQYGEIVHVSAFPSNYELQCITPGTTASTRAAIDNYLNQNS